MIKWQYLDGKGDGTYAPLFGCGVSFARWLGRGFCAARERLWAWNFCHDLSAFFSAVCCPCGNGVLPVFLRHVHLQRSEIPQEYLAENGNSHAVFGIACHTVCGVFGIKSGARVLQNGNRHTVYSVELVSSFLSPLSELYFFLSIKVVE